MKNKTIILGLLLMLLTGHSFSQEVTGQAKTHVKPALLVIDIQNVYLQMIPDRDKEVGLYYINALIELFRNNGYPVIRIYALDTESGPKPGTEEFEFPASVQIKPDDPRVIKTYGDSFNKTELDEILRKEGSNTVFLCGLSAVGCVLATWIGAQNHDYKAFMVKDAIMSHNTEYTKNVESMFDAVSYDVVKLILESSEK
jgi:nicotinamidase-related amidase